MTSAFLFLLGIFFTTAAGAVSVSLVTAYDPASLTWLRFVSMLAIFPVIVAAHPPSFRRPTGRQGAGLAVLGVASLMGLLLLLVSLQGIDLATSTGLFFCYPFLSVGLAALFLREKVGALVWALTLLGLFGVVYLFNPQSAGISVYSLAALGSGAAVAVKMLLTRALGLGLPSLTTAAGEALVAAILLLPFIDLTTVASGQMLGHLALYLVLSNASRISVVIALSRAQVATLAPLGYAEIAFAAGFQWFVFGTEVPAQNLAAFAVILAAGLAVAYLRGASMRGASMRGVVARRA